MARYNKLQQLEISLLLRDAKENGTVSDLLVKEFENLFAAKGERFDREAFRKRIYGGE